MPFQQEAGHSRTCQCFASIVKYIFSALVISISVVLLDKLFAATSACNIVTTKAKPVNSFIAPTGQGHCYPSQPAFYDIYIPPCAHSWSLVLRNRLLLPYSDAKFGGISADLAIQLSVMSLKFLSVSSTIIHNIHEE